MRPVPQNAVIPGYKTRAGRGGLRSDQGARERETEIQRVAGGRLVIDAAQQRLSSGQTIKSTVVSREQPAEVRVVLWNQCLPLLRRDGDQRRVSRIGQLIHVVRLCAVGVGPQPRRAVQEEVESSRVQLLILIGHEVEEFILLDRPPNGAARVEVLVERFITDAGTDLV